jgi:octaprenyl-diphosphate synthase
MKIYNDFRHNLPKDVRQSLNKTLLKIRSFKNSDFIVDGLFRPSVHLLKSGGKLLRPSLLFLSAKAMGESCNGFVDLAAAIELLHVSSLIHDDIIDKGTYRRGVKTVNSLYGDSAALLAGNALISKAILLSSKYGKGVMDAVADTAMQMSAGELMDYHSQKGNKTISKEDYLNIAKFKTASLMGTSCNIVAIYKKSNLKSMLYNYGFNIGLAFQIRDDIMDYAESKKDYSKNAKSGANIVTLIKQKEDLSTKESLEIAIKLNQFYIKKALAQIKGKKVGKSLEPYAKMIEVKSN